MGSASNSLEKWLSAVHRSVWRNFIFWLIAFVSLLGATRSVGLFFFAAAFVLMPFGIIREHRDPHPEKLGLSDPKSARLNFLIFAIVDGVAILILSTIGLTPWPWALVPPALTFLAYALRPKQ